MSGGNVLVPIVAHVIYDFLTFVEVHNRATAQLKTSLERDLPQKAQGKRAAVTSFCPLLGSVRRDVL